MLIEITTLKYDKIAMLYIYMYIYIYIKCIVTNKYASRVLEYNYTNSQENVRDTLIPTIYI